MEHRFAPTFRQSGNGRQFVRDAKGEHQPGAFKHFTRRQFDLEAIRLARRAHSFPRDEGRRRIRRNLRARGCEHRAWLLPS